MSRDFDDDALKAAYETALGDAAVVHGPDCPSETALLSAVRGEGKETERLRVLDHALKCAACRRELALLNAVSGSTPRKASRPIKDFLSNRWMPTAIAASLVLAVGVAGVERFRGRASEDITRAGGASGPLLVTPANGTAVSAGLVRFVWRPVAEVIHYTLEVDSPDGTVLVSSQTRDTTFTAPIAATAVGENRWLIRAKMQDGSEKRSDTRVLRVR
jgi:hypothetical protein